MVCFDTSWRQRVAYVTISASVAFSEVVVQRMVPEAEAKTWYGIAQLNVTESRWCNVALISETEVLTEAH
ncbi:hypothetical protein GCM10011517_01940 [Actibacterium pelagium]|uniref:Uncharacterized protein n=1 Tax=Actibacterium pelagium TaxID=2029103 RepID=A0A917AA62_9RHOB|nr:hypothetical protein GCM10011517_01940 [Actibacterium pelagium]